MLLNFISIAIGAVFGASLRYAIEIAILKITTNHFHFLTATLIANLLGCFLAGCLLAISEKHNILSEQMRLLISVGFLGSLTTFSAIISQSFKLLNNGQFLPLILYLTSSIMLGIGLFFIAYIIVK